MLDQPFPLNVFIIKYLPQLSFASSRLLSILGSQAYIKLFVIQSYEYLAVSNGTDKCSR